MEYFIARAMEASRMTPEEMGAIHTHERLKGRVLMPYEIQECLKKNPLKDHFCIPDDDAQQLRHKQRIRTELEQHNVMPKYDFQVDQIQQVHEFDEKVLDLSSRMAINFEYSTMRPRKSLKESLL